MEIVSREEWGAEDPRRIELTEHREMYLHHTVGSGVRDKDGDGDLGDDYTKDVQHFHIHTRGWDDIAYNFLIDPDGLEVYEGQGWGREPNAQAGHNEGTFAVAVMGDFRTAPTPPELLDKIAELIRYGQDLGHLPTDVPLLGHRDAPGSEGNTCPGGNLYAKLGEINERIEEVALSPEDLAAIKQLLEEHDNTFVYTNSAGQARRISGLAVNSTWHVDIAGRRALDLVAGLKDMPTANLQELADAVMDELKNRL